MERVPAWKASDGNAFFNRSDCARHEAELELRLWFKDREVMGPETLGDEAVKDAANLLAVLKRVVPPKAKEAPAAPEPGGESGDPGAESAKPRGRRRGGLAGG